MILYVKRGCPWCVGAVNYLRRQQFRFQEIDVLSDPAAYATMRRLSGQSLAPTLVVNDRVLSDFDTGQLEDFLGTHGIRPQ